MNQILGYPHLSWYVSKLRSIPGGNYHFGASPSRNILGTPTTVSPFRMGATPVTWGMWKEYRRSVAVPGKEIKLPEDPGWGYPDDHPVVNVSWSDIMDPGGFCEWASDLVRFKLTLPTDTQWEYSARGGQDGLEYPWGNDLDKSKLWCSIAQFSNKTAVVGRTDRTSRTAAVDRTDRIYRNGYGLTDMVGNVSQWCADYYNDDYRPTGKDSVDTRKSFNERRCVRGGAWLSLFPESVRCADRSLLIPGGSNYGIGFRLSASPK